ncbi:MAG: tryptophan 7-halogenase [Planctomycetes bacterium]|nr:tryptophan 7-halogenase [Planctomycetota bacterium]
MPQRQEAAAAHDVLVVGAGPAGATAAGLFAQRGLRVLVLEKDEFPRFHIGESLLPMCLPVLERLGVPATDDVFVFKQGAEFVCEASGRKRQFVFTETLPGCGRHAWHVDRARFDRALRDAAVRAGAEIRHGETVVDAGVEHERAFVRTRTATFHGRYLIDASGQSRLLARRADAAVPYETFGRSSVFTHYEGIGDAAWDELGPGKNIRIVMSPGGWGWVIPLPDRRLSIGLVGRGKITEDDLQQYLLSGPLVTRLTQGSRRLETRVIGNFSYRNHVPSGARFACIGDAACFLDPVFSSGVTLALRGAEAIADIVGPALEQGREGDPTLLQAHEVGMDRAYRTFAGLIDRFYNTPFAETMFLGPPAEDPQLRRGIMSVLAGDVWRSGNVFQDMLLAARRHDPDRRGAKATPSQNDG